MEDSRQLSLFPTTRPWTRHVLEIGAKYNRLEVLGEGVRSPGGLRRWRCRCECGTVTNVQPGHLVSGKTRSCGCLQKEAARRPATERQKAAVKAARTTHGKRQTPEYNSWAAMWSRCTNPKNSHYAHYGGRGIMICAEWKTFERFYDNMGPKPTAKHSIDRVDNDGNYEPSNCRWATSSQQAKNRQRRYGYKRGPGFRPTHCHRGHEFTEQNTYWNKTNGKRQCRACGAENARRRRGKPSE